MKRVAAILALAVGTAAFMRPLHPRRVDVALGAKRRLKKALSDAKKPKRASKKASAAPVRSLDEEIAKRERPHLLFDRGSREIVALSTGVCEATVDTDDVESRWAYCNNNPWPGHYDKTYTHVQLVRR